jgi:hypothetical protein
LGILVTLHYAISCCPIFENQRLNKPFCKGQKNPMCETSAKNQYAMTAQCEFVRDVGMRSSKICEDFFHEVVKKLFVVYFMWLYF